MSDSNSVKAERSVAIIGTRGYPSYYGGFETAVRKLAPYLAERGWDVTVYGRPGAVKLDDPEVDHRVHSVLTKGIESKSLSTLSYGLTATASAARRRPDAALVMNVANGFFLPVLRARGVPTLVNVDGLEWERAKWGRAARAMFRAGARVTAWWATKLVFDAKAIGARWNQDFKRDGYYIPYGGESRADLPLEPGLQRRKYVLFVARFVPENTVDEFLTAAESLASGTDVVIVGSSGYGGEFDERAKALDDRYEHVHWLGHVSDDRRLLGLWNHAGAYFHGHSVGGTNPALVQAMANGAPTVARDTVYNREVLAETGEFVSADAHEIAAALRQLLADGDRQEDLASSARSRASEHYTWELVCGRYESALIDLIEAKRKNR